jgi:hypothetical protein
MSREAGDFIDVLRMNENAGIFCDLFWLRDFPESRMPVRMLRRDGSQKSVVLLT